MSKGRFFLATAADGTKTKCFAKDGWVLMDGTLTGNQPRSEEELKRIAAFGKPQEYEFAHVTQSGNKLRVIYRHESRKPKA